MARVAEALMFRSPAAKKRVVRFAGLKRPKSPARLAPINPRAVRNTQFIPTIQKTGYRGRTWAAMAAVFAETTRARQIFETGPT